MEHTILADCAHGISRLVRDGLSRHLPDKAALERLCAYSSRYLDPEGNPHGLMFTPAMICHKLALSLGIPEPQALPLSAAAHLFYLAADLADDCADDELHDSLPIDLNDAFRCLFVQQALLTEIPEATPETRLRLIKLFASCGSCMAAGQEADIRSSQGWPDAMPVLDIAEAKAGAEFEAIMAAPALLAGLSPLPWADFGHAYGSLAQIISDYLDLLLKPVSKDWQDGKPTLPLIKALENPQWGPQLALLLAGRRRDAEEEGVAKWILAQDDCGRHLMKVRETYQDRMAQALQAAGQPAILASFLQGILEITDEILNALDEYKLEEAPAVLTLSTRLNQCQKGIESFLAADPLFCESYETHRWGLFGQAEVRADLFGPLVIADALLDIGYPVKTACLEAILSRHDSDGWRYYPGHYDIPTDADDTGMALQLMARLHRLNHPMLLKSLAALQSNEREDGLTYTWLADGKKYQREEIDAAWMGAFCPGVAANAFLGKFMSTMPQIPQPGAQSLIKLVLENQDEHSSFYRPVTALYLMLKALLGVSSTDQARQLDLDQAFHHGVERLTGRRRLNGSLGSVIDTSLGSWCLWKLGALKQSRELFLKFLIGEQAADGGYAAEPYFMTIGTGMSADWYASRLLTTALAYRSLILLSGYP